MLENDEIDKNLDQAKQKIDIPSVVKIIDLSIILSEPVTEIIKKLLSNGVLATINDNIDFDTAAILADDFGFEAIEKKSENIDFDTEDTEEGEIDKRAPIVTVMGHVDHGKTSLLDYIRKTKVALGESGGITQHIGSYQVKYKDQTITFLDTPGHAAFSAIRAQGTKVTDVVVLVVAADDGVKLQTIEAIKLAQATSLPIIVAITKIDKPGVNLDMIKKQLGEYGILTESWGGKVPLVKVSAKTGAGVDDLLDLISLTSEIAELSARKTGKARGIIIETQHSVKVGQLVTVIIKAGRLIVGDNFVVGSTYGKVKSLQDYNSKRVREALPSMPVVVTGFTGEPKVGDMLIVVDNEKQARHQASNNRVSSTNQITKSQGTLEILVNQIKSQKIQNLNIVIKADVQGSLQAVINQLAEIKTDRDNKIIVIASGVGNISESDVLAAAGGNAFVVGFKVRTLPGASQMAQKEKIKILSYDIIYELTDDLTNILIESVGLKRIEEIVASGEVLKLFMATPKQKIVGVKIQKGEVKKEYLFRVYRENKMLGDGAISSIKHIADEVEVASKGDFGFSVELNFKIREGDKIEFIKVEHLKAKIIT